MFCMNCGSQLADGSKFCPNCGAKLNEAPAAEPEVVVEPAAPVEQPAYEPQATDIYAAIEAAQAAQDAQAAESNAAEIPFVAQPIPEAAPAQKPEKAASKLNLGALIGIGAAAIAVLLVVVLLITGAFTGARGKLAKAVGKSVDAYAAVYSDMGGTDVSGLLESKKLSQEISLTINKVDGDNTLDGLGIRVNSDLDLPGQKFDLAVTPFYESADIATVQLGLHGTQLFVGSPELTSGQYYGVDTATLGQDISEFTGEDSMETLSFNLYDFAEAVEDIQEIDSINSGFVAANKALFKSFEVEKQGRESIKVNGNEVKATKYTVVLTTDAIEDYVDALEGSVDVDALIDSLIAAYETLGLPEDVLDEMADELENIELDYFFDGIRDVVDEMDDVEFDAYIANGYLVAAEYVIDMGTKVTVQLQLGGGKHYVDDLSLSFKVKGEGEVVLSSTGNHSGAGGVFTDETTVTMKEGSSRETVFASEFEYSKKDGACEGKVELGEDTTVSFEGTLEMSKSALDIQLSELKVKSWGDTVFEGAVGYSLGSYKNPGVKASDVTMLLSLSETELMETAAELYENLTTLVEDLDLDIPLPGGITGDVEGPSVAYGDDTDYWYGYDIGYNEGYDDGWYETDYDDSNAYLLEGDAIDGYLDGYYWGYDDGYWGYDYGTSY